MRGSACVFSIVLLALLISIQALPASRGLSPSPVIQGQNIQIDSSSSTSHSIVVPTSATPSFYLVCIQENNGITVTWPAGWYEFTSAVATGFHCADYFSSGLVTNPIAVTFGSAAKMTAASYRIEGVRATYFATATAASATPDPPSVTAPTQEHTLWIAAYGWLSAQTQSAYPSGFILSQQTLDGNSLGMSMSAAVITTQTENPGSGTITGSSTWTALTLALLPVQPSLSVSFAVNPNTGTKDTTVSFYSNVSGGLSPYEYNWTFGDGGSSSLANPTHEYLRDGNFNVTLVVTDALSNRARFSIQVAISTPSDMWILLFEAMAYLVFLAFGLGFGLSHDNVLWLALLIPAGMVMLALSFQAWTVSSSYFASISLAMVAIVTIAFPVVMLLRSFLT